MATMFSPSLVEKRKPISSDEALTNRANCPRTTSVLASISPSEIGRVDLRSMKSRPAATTEVGTGAMYAELR